MFEKQEAKLAQITDGLTRLAEPLAMAHHGQDIGLHDFAVAFYGAAICADLEKLKKSYVAHTLTVLRDSFNANVTVVNELARGVLLSTHTLNEMLEPYRGQTVENVPGEILTSYKTHFDIRNCYVAQMDKHIGMVQEDITTLMCVPGENRQNREDALEAAQTVDIEIDIKNHGLECASFYNTVSLMKAHADIGVLNIKAAHMHLAYLGGYFAIDPDRDPIQRHGNLAIASEYNSRAQANWLAVAEMLDHTRKIAPTIRPGIN